MIYEPVIENVGVQIVVCKGEVIHVCVLSTDVPGE